MKILIFTCLSIVFSVASIGSLQADPEITVSSDSSYCHWPQDADNANNETFQGSCTGKVTVTINAGVVTADGSVRMVLTDLFGSSPYASNTILSENANKPNDNLQCILNDSNGNTYISQNWYFSAYPETVRGSHRKISDFKDHFGTVNSKYDFNRDGVVNFADIAAFNARYRYTKTTYALTCRDGVQQ